MSGTSGLSPGIGFRKQLMPSTVVAGAVSLTNPLLSLDATGKIVIPTGITTNLFRFSYVGVLLRITAAATLAGDTLGVLVDTAFSPLASGGFAATDWVNVIAFALVLGNGGTKRFFQPLNNAGGIVASPYDVSADLAAGNARSLILGDMLRVRHVGVGTGSFTYQIDGFAQ